MTLLALALFGLFALLILVGFPIALSLGVASVGCVLLFDLTPLTFLPQLMLGSADSFTLLAIPFFILAGSILGRTGVASRLIHLAEVLLGSVAGGLGIVTVVVSIFFAGISGSGPADVAALGAILIPAMISARYAPGFASALTAAGGGIGIIMPPSIALIIYGVVAETSISKLFIAGIIPGILVGVSLILVVFFLSRRSGYRGTTSRGNIRDVLRAAREASWGLLAPVIILGGIYGGIFTPTEAAAVAVGYALLVDLLAYHDLSWRDLPRIAADAAITSAVVMFIVMTAALFAWILNVEGIAESLSEGLLRIAPHPLLALLLINLILILAGCFMDAISIFYIFVPILLPAAVELGVDPVQFGIIMTVNLAIGQITPPVGVNLFVACGVSRISLDTISRSVWPFILAEAVALLLITYIPALSLWLPGLVSIR